MLPPLITTGVAGPASGSDLQSKEAMPPADPSRAPPSLHIASIEDRRSVCQSPSWEAYGRRKKEKKDKEIADKEAKARKRRLSKAPPSSMSSSSSTPTSSNFNLPRTPHTPGEGALFISDTLNIRPHPSTRPRPASTLCLSTTNLPVDPPTPHTPRGRSGSFSAIFKATSRRSSIDTSHDDSHFIGGIKLEQHRLATTQQALNEQAVLSEGDIHPAFRRPRRSSSPLRFFTPKHEPKDAKQRHYPPISIKTSGKNQALLAPEPAISQEGMMKKWRERFGHKAAKATPTDAKQGQKLTKPQSGPSQQNNGRVFGGRNVSTPVIGSDDWTSRAQATTSEQKVQTAAKSTPLASSALSTTEHWQSEYVIPPLFSTESHEELKNAFAPKDKGSGSAEGQSDSSESQSSFKTAPDTSHLTLPPAPPRRSSKRKSAVSMNDAQISPLASPSNPLGVEFHPTATRSPGKDKRASVTFSMPESSSPPKPAIQRKPVSKQPDNRRHSTLSNPPSISYESLDPHKNSAHAKRTLRDAAKAVFGSPTMQSSSSASFAKPISQPYSPGTKTDEIRSVSSTNVHSTQEVSRVSKSVEQAWRKGNLAAISPPTSEDSCSEEFQPSAPSTPDTSRPQSEREGYSINRDDKYAHRYDLPSPTFSYESGVSDRFNKPDIDPVQDAAMKVMAAFDNPPKRANPDRRSNSDPNLAALLPKLKNPALYPRDRSPRTKTRIREADVKSPSLRDLMMSKDESSVASPWPATYLEAARKAAPAAPKPLVTRSRPSSSTTAQSSTASTPKISHTSPNISSSSAIPHHSPHDSDPIAKMFVECCACKYYHDMPSKLYAAMANPEDVVSLGEFAGDVKMTVKCPWCKHEMSTGCCAGFAAVVYVKERLH